ncbi:MAG: hypothetical protein KKE23_02335, partial [Nanoarchaeota archaeon]|nr:hypothetical protein [Nanoarchaeota archaeon]
MEMDANRIKEIITSLRNSSSPTNELIARLQNYETEVRTTGIANANLLENFLGEYIDTIEKISGYGQMITDKDKRLNDLRTQNVDLTKKAQDYEFQIQNQVENNQILLDEKGKMDGRYNSLKIEKNDFEAKLKESLETIISI